MDLTDRQRKLLFAGLVIVLAAVGVFLTIGGADDDRHAVPAIEHAHAERGAEPASAPPVTGPPPSPGSYDIYSMLPFSKKDFNAAADVAQRFTVAYGTYRLTRTRRRTRPYARHGHPRPGDASSPQGASAPGPARAAEAGPRDLHLRRRAGLAPQTWQRTSSSSSRPGTQHVTKGGKTSDTSEQYAVTVMPSPAAAGWSIAFAPADMAISERREMKLCRQLRSASASGGVTMAVVLSLPTI